LLSTPSDVRDHGVGPTERNVRFDRDQKAAKASLVTASSIPHSKRERTPGADESMPGVLVNWQKLRFGSFELSIGERRLRRDGQVLPIGGRALDILIYLAERPGEVIAKQELLDRVWLGITVGEGSIRVHVSAIRKVLGDGQFGNRYIANIKGRGYSFVGIIVVLAGSAESRSRRRYKGEKL
jgi:DNA-binding winged helix-turn-helix (wHTH) protein